MKSFFRDCYVTIIISVLFVVALVSAILISWPAIAHLASKLH